MFDFLGPAFNFITNPIVIGPPHINVGSSLGLPGVIINLGS